jgi:uncharacterized protein YggE
MRKVGSVLLVILLMVICLGAGAIAGPHFVPELIDWAYPSQQTAATQLQVSGSGRISVQPDTALLTLGISEKASDANSAQQAVNDKLSKVLASLKEKGVQDDQIVSQNLSLYPEYTSLAGLTRLVSYTASTTLEIKTTLLDEVGGYVDAALSAGANELQGVEFSLSNEREIRRQAIQLALKDARANAEAIAQAENMQLDALISVDQGSGGVHVRNFSANVNNVLAEADTAESGAGTSIQSGEVVVTSNVNCLYSAK